MTNAVEQAIKDAALAGKAGAFGDTVRDAQHALDALRKEQPSHPKLGTYSIHLAQLSALEGMA